MAYRDNEDYQPSGNRRFYWPELDSLGQSRSVARKAFGGWVFAGMIVLGILFTFFSGKSPVDMKTTEANVVGVVIGNAIELAFVLFASWRMTSGKGWIVSWLLFALFVFEAVTKLFAKGGPGAVGWIFFYFAIGASILSGARACWDIRARSRSGEADVSSEEMQTIFE